MCFIRYTVNLSCNSVYSSFLTSYFWTWTISFQSVWKVTLNISFLFPNERNQILLLFFFNLLSCRFNSSQLTESSLPKYGLSEIIKLNRCLAKLVLCVAFLRCLTVQPLMANQIEKHKK